MPQIGPYTIEARANLVEADLVEADLREADLREAHLRMAYLRRADLREADLRGADLCGADLREADLRGADLRMADLGAADLRRTDLRGADLRGANFRGANFRGAEVNTETQLPPISILPKGDFIGWKKLRGEAIAKILIPADAARVKSTGRKCRAEYVKIIAVFCIDGSPMEEGISAFNNTTAYRVGEITKPDSYNGDWRVECSHGIHFFLTRAEAEAY